MKFVHIKSERVSSQYLLIQYIIHRLSTKKQSICITDRILHMYHQKILKVYSERKTIEMFQVLNRITVVSIVY